jgi:hypothetical protein
VIADRVGTGRRHGEIPVDGMELKLYQATHYPTSTYPPDIELVAELIRWYYTLPGCETGGSLHIVLEDQNCDDEFLQWSAGLAFGVGDTCGAELAELLLSMDVYRRVHAVDLATGG